MLRHRSTDGLAPAFGVQPVAKAPLSRTPQNTSVGPLERISSGSEYKRYGDQREDIEWLGVQKIRVGRRRLFNLEAVQDALAKRAVETRETEVAK